MRNNSSRNPIGLMADRRPDLLTGMLGILKSGNGFVPIDPDYPNERINFIISDCRIQILVTQEKHLDRALEIAHGSASLKRIICLDKARKEVAGSGAAEIYDFDDYSEIELRPGKNDVDPDHLAYVIYTSGSTGAPKGAPITHGNLSPLLCWSRKYFNFGERTGVLQNLNYCFDFGVFELLTTVLFGGTLHFVNRDELSDYAEYADYINSHGINTLHTTPSFFRNILPFIDRLENLETLHLGGEPLTGNLVNEIFSKVGDSCVIYNGYGPTEATVNCSIFRVGDKSAWKDKALSNIPIGKASANNLIYILNRNCEPPPVGVPGELCIGGVGLSRGYLNRADLTAKAFIPDPFSDEPGARMYRTGDLARYLPDGDIEFLGRIDQQVKVRGFRIELGEIESALGGHPDVRENVVIAREGADGNKQLVAYLVSNRKPAPAVGALRGYLSEKLPGHMVPTAYVFLDHIPLTPNGKVDRRALPEPDESRPELANHYVAPRDRKEEIMAEIWAQVIGVERVGVYDNFFELGGDSMKSIQVVARANRAGIHLTPTLLFQRATIASLVQAAGASQKTEAEQGIVTGQVPLTPIQRSFFEGQLVDPHHWNWSFMLETTQSLDPALLEQTLKRLLSHHDALRLRFYSPNASYLANFVELADLSESGCLARSEWRQFNAGLDETVPFTAIDLSQLGLEEQRAALEAAAACLQRSLNLSEGPLLRMAYFDMGEEQADRALLIFHHLVVDMFSSHILMEDFQKIYQRLKDAVEVDLPPKTTSFREWSQRLAEYAQSRELKQELSYWMESLNGSAPAMPLDYPAGDNNEASTEAVVTSFSKEETRALLQEIPAATGARMEEVLLAALARSWSSWTGQPGLFVDVDGHGRENILEGADLSRTVGWFTSVYPVLFDLERAVEPVDALRAVQAQLRRVPNRGIGFGLLRYLCEDEEAQWLMRRTPKAEVNFNYQGQLDPPGARRNEETPFRPARDNKGPERSLNGKRSYRLYVVASAHGGALRIRWSYSSNLHKRSAIERLASSFEDELRRLIASCLSPEADRRKTANPGGRKHQKSASNETEDYNETFSGFDYN
ncbi:MAG: amino acid adenylation domain-containing protein [Acidobacteria bacterium]|nr:amino acid adenylation domain-containing protein [Acidobacteriota bacterium]